MDQIIPAVRALKLLAN